MYAAEEALYVDNNLSEFLFKRATISVGKGRGIQGLHQITPERRAVSKECECRWNVGHISQGAVSRAADSTGTVSRVWCNESRAAWGMPDGGVGARCHPNRAGIGRERRNGTKTPQLHYMSNKPPPEPKKQAPRVVDQILENLGKGTVAITRFQWNIGCINEDCVNPTADNARVISRNWTHESKAAGLGVLGVPTEVFDLRWIGDLSVVRAVVGAQIIGVAVHNGRSLYPETKRVIAQSVVGNGVSWLKGRLSIVLEGWYGGSESQTLGEYMEVGVKRPTLMTCWCRP
ncbi:hypothetical protein FB45DRAFT_873110 [Roridomyces roridus]|uniref:Uncharacterized protein n=1 Tax=Roridomyces roridus TaxID=1738132 RepID=A0AAD7FD32_9AGAR|nr:hypothetical protein FB45DRAFT_873110 [Roridomyces roridus]